MLSQVLLSELLQFQFRTDNRPVTCTYLTLCTHKMDTIDMHLLVWTQSGTKAGNITWIEVAKPRSISKWNRLSEIKIDKGLYYPIRYVRSLYSQISFHLWCQAPFQFNTVIARKRCELLQCASPLYHPGAPASIAFFSSPRHRDQTHVSAKYTKRNIFSHHDLCLAGNKHSSLLCRGSYCSGVCFLLCQNNTWLLYNTIKYVVQFRVCDQHRRAWS